MFRTYWRQPQFWLWCWRTRVSAEAKRWLAAVTVTMLLTAGFLAATSVEGEANNAESAFETLTIERVVTEPAWTVVRPVQVVRRVTERSGVLGTAVEVRTVTTAGKDRVVTQREVVPVVERDVVTVPGRLRTVVETRQGVVRTVVETRQGAVRTVVETQRGSTRTVVVTSERVVTRDRVVTDERVVTVARTVVQPVTATHAVTQTVPVTVRETETVTVPATVTVEVPVTVTVTGKKPPG